MYDTALCLTNVDLVSFEKVVVGREIKAIMEMYQNNTTAVIE